MLATRVGHVQGDGATVEVADVDGAKLLENSEAAKPEEEKR